MTTDMRLEGIHHVTCITGDAPRNVEFYARTLGLRLVKKTVNQDDPTVYHLFYADEAGSPGADITFFEYPRRGPGRPARAWCTSSAGGSRTTRRSSSGPGGSVRPARRTRAARDAPVLRSRGARPRAGGGRDGRRGVDRRPSRGAARAGAAGLRRRARILGGAGALARLPRGRTRVRESRACSSGTHAASAAAARTPTTSPASEALRAPARCTMSPGARPWRSTRRGAPVPRREARSRRR